MHPSEQETTMTWDSEQQVVRIFSARRVDQGKLRRAGVLPVKDTQPHGLFYEIPLSRFKWRISTGKPSLRGFGSRKLHTNVGITTRKGTPDEQ